MIRTRKQKRAPNRAYKGKRRVVRKPQPSRPVKQTRRPQPSRPQKEVRRPQVSKPAKDKTGSGSLC